MSSLSQSTKARSKVDRDFGQEVTSSIGSHHVGTATEVGTFTNAKSEIGKETIGSKQVIQFHYFKK